MESGDEMGWEWRLGWWDENGDGDGMGWEWRLDWDWGLLLEFRVNKPARGSPIRAHNLLLDYHVLEAIIIIKIIQ